MIAHGACLAPQSHHLVDQTVLQRDRSEMEMSVHGGVHSKLPNKKQSSRLFPSLQSVRLAEIEDALSHSRVENMTMESSGCRRMIDNREAIARWAGFRF
jgi:hypothetical protein